MADGAIIGLTNLTRPAAETAAMHHEAEVRMGAVFVCALDETARDRSIVSLDALKVDSFRLAKPCRVATNSIPAKLLRDVTALAPDFAQGWGTLDGTASSSERVITTRRRHEGGAGCCCTRARDRSTQLGRLGGTRHDQDTDR